METYAHDSIAELLDAYREDLDQGRREGWWARCDYVAPTGFGTLHFQPLNAAGEPGGPVDKTWRVYIDVGRGTVERHITDDYLPTVEEAADTIDATIQQAQPTRDSEQDRLTRQARDLADQITVLQASLRRTILDAVDAGVKKTTIADAAGISRVTLDKWLADR